MKVIIPCHSDNSDEVSRRGNSCSVEFQSDPISIGQYAYCAELGVNINEYFSAQTQAINCEQVYPVPLHMINLPNDRNCEISFGNVSDWS